MSDKEGKITIAYKNETTQVNFEGNLEDGLKLLNTLHTPKYWVNIEDGTPLKDMPSGTVQNDKQWRLKFI